MTSGEAARTVDGSGVMPMRCAVIGSGAWGTAIADRLARNGHHTVLWAREDDVVDAVNTRHENPRFLANIALAPSLTASTDMAAALHGARRMYCGRLLRVARSPSSPKRSCRWPPRASSAKRWHS
jgi:2-polyprenyl-6-methoxyphenol hydroxylase-like FAD-dependent oxidoreductase